MLFLIHNQQVSLVYKIQWCKETSIWLKFHHTTGSGILYICSYKHILYMYLSFRDIIKSYLKETFVAQQRNYWDFKYPFYSAINKRCSLYSTVHVADTVLYSIPLSLVILVTYQKQHTNSHGHLALQLETY